MIATGTPNGELVRYELNFAASEEEDLMARELAATAVLERAIGLAVTDLVSVMCRALVHAEHSLSYEVLADDVRKGLERLVALPKRARQCGMSLGTAVSKHGRRVLKERYGGDLQDRIASMLIHEAGRLLVKWLEVTARPREGSAPNINARE
jgi:hypothetical protein